MAQNFPSIVFKDVSKQLPLYKENRLKNAFAQPTESKTKTVVIFKKINFTVQQGETIGLYGPNGSGKTTLLRLIANILAPDRGSIKVRGRVIPVLELGAGLHPDLSGQENIFLYSSILGVTKSQAKINFFKIVSFSGIKKFINLPVKKLSTGMKARLAFSIATHSQPDILLLDEVVTVGDQSFRQKSIKKIKHLSKKTTIVFTSHSLSLMHYLCDRTLQLKNHTLHSDEKLASFLKLLPHNQTFVAQVESNSMYPLVKKNNQVTIKPLPFSQIKPGDIIAFYFPSLPTIIIHRVTHALSTKSQKIVLTKGDNSFMPDSWQITKESYLGKIITIKGKKI